MKRLHKTMLLSTASAAAAAFFLPGTAAAQTVCTVGTPTATNNVFECVNGTAQVATGTTDPTTTVTPGAQGFATSSAGNQSVTLAAGSGGNTITTNNAAPAVSLSSSGTLNLVGAPVNITTNAAGANALNLSGVGTTATIGNLVASGDGSAGVNFVGNGGTVNVTTGTITANGAGSIGVVGSGGTNTTISTGNISAAGTTGQGVSVASTGPLSVTTGTINAGGFGLNLASTGGSVTTNSGLITAGVQGVFAQGDGVSVTANGVTSLGGGINAQATGTGGVIVRSGAVSAVGATAINATSTTGAINIGTCPTVATTGANAAAITATSTTGNITANCGAVTTAGATSDGVRLNSSGGDVLAATTSVSTTGADSDAFEVVTGGAGTVTVNAGNLTTTGADSAGLSITNGTGAVNAGFGNITTSGDTSAGLAIQSTGAVAVNASAGSSIRTNGPNSDAVVIVGNGVTGTLGNVTAAGSTSFGVVVNSTDTVDLTIGNVSATERGIVVVAGSSDVDLSTGTVASTGTGAEATVIDSTGAVSFTGGRQTAIGADALQINGGAGAISATVNGAGTTGDAADAVQITGAGPVTFTNTGPITTAGVGSRGVSISGVTTASATCGNISTTGANSPAFELVANGNTTVTCGTITTTGAASDGIAVTNASGTTTVTGGTTTVSGADSIGIDVATAGTGAVTVNTGVVSQTGANAAADPSFSAVRVIASGAAPVSVVANGNVSSTNGAGIWAQSAGTASVTVNSGVTVQGGTTGVVLGGATGNTLIVNGTLRRTGVATGPAYIVAGAGPLTLTLGANGSIVGPLTFTAGNDTFNNASNYTQSGVIDFLAGNDTFNNLGTFTQNAAVNFGDGDDVVNNTGTYNAVGTTDFGVGTDVFNNQAAGTLRVTGGAATFANLETFNNRGLITMVDGAANDSLTISGNYVGTNGRLALDVVGTAGGLTSDRLFVGGNISGTTSIEANIINPVIDVDGVILVDGAGTVAANSFTLADDQDGFINYSLVTQGNDVLLVTSADAAIGDAVLLNRVGQEMWYQSFDAINQVMASRRIDYGQERSNPLGFWAQLYGSTDKSGDRNREFTAFGTTLTGSDRLKTHRRGAQVGIDFVGSNFAIGATTGYERAKTDSDLGSDIKAEGTNYGAYAQFGMENGLYGAILAKRDNYDVRISNDGLGLGFVKPDGRSTGIDGEVGFRFGGTETATFAAFAGLSRVNSKLDGYSYGNIQFDDESYKSLRGRLGARAGFAGKLAPFVEGKIFREFKGDNDVRIGSGTLVDTIEGEGRGTWVRLEGGIGGGQGGGPLITGWADFGDVKGFGLRGGFRF